MKPLSIGDFIVYNKELYIITKSDIVNLDYNVVCVVSFTGINGVVCNGWDMDHCHDTMECYKAKDVTIWDSQSFTITTTPEKSEPYDDGSVNLFVDF